MPYQGKFERAIVCACRLHKDQHRKGTSIPYVTHLLALAAIVDENGGTEDEVVATGSERGTIVPESKSSTGLSPNSKASHEARAIHEPLLSNYGTVVAEDLDRVGVGVKDANLYGRCG